MEPSEGIRTRHREQYSGKRLEREISRPGGTQIPVDLFDKKL